jgi:uncharacterized protein YjbJ (UPF0337 family)
MDSDRCKVQWKQSKGKVKSHWRKLTYGDITAVESNSGSLSGKLQERYGITKKEADKQVKEFRSSL